MWTPAPLPLTTLMAELSVYTLTQDSISVPFIERCQHQGIPDLVALFTFVVHMGNSGLERNGDISVFPRLSVEGEGEGRVSRCFLFSILVSISKLDLCSLPDYSGTSILTMLLFLGAPEFVGLKHCLALSSLDMWWNVTFLPSSITLIISWHL